MTQKQINEVVTKIVELLKTSSGVTTLDDAKIKQAQGLAEALKIATEVEINSN